MSKDLTLTDAHKVMKELRNFLRIRPSEITFYDSVNYSQLGRKEYQSKFKNKLTKQFNACKERFQNKLDVYDDFLKLKTLIANKNAEVGLNDILTELSMINTKLDWYNQVVSEVELKSKQFDSSDYTVYSSEKVNDIYREAEFDYNTIVKAPQFDGNFNRKTIHFSLFDRQEAIDQYNDLVKRITTLQKERDTINQKTKINVELSEVSIKLSGL